MVEQEDNTRGIPGVTELTNKEWQFLNKFCEPGSRLWNKQLKTIDKLRGKYPQGSPAWEGLDIFDPRTGVAERNAEIAQHAFDLYHEGKAEEAQALIDQLKHR